MLPIGPDGATPTRQMTVSGIVKTTAGYALLSVVISKDGDVLSMELANSQAFPEHVAREHQRRAVADALKVQAGG